MADLELKGTLDFKGSVNLVPPSGGKVTAGGSAVLVEVSGTTGSAHGTAPPPVPIPPPPSPPSDTGVDVWIIKSFNSTVQAGGKNIVAQGMLMQGTSGSAHWPGMVLPSTGNTGVKAGSIAMNVVNDMGIVMPSGGSATFTADQQG